MLFNKSKRKAALHIETLIGNNTTIAGDLRFQGGMRIEGTVIGNVTGIGEHSVLVISDTARVEGEIEAAHVVIGGAVKGSVNSTELLELRSTARLASNVLYKMLEIEPGAEIEGSLHRDDSEGSPVLRLAAAKAIASS